MKTSSIGIDTIDVIDRSCNVALNNGMRLEIAVEANASLCAVTRTVDSSSVVRIGWANNGAIDSRRRRCRRRGWGVSSAFTCSKGEVSQKEVRILNIECGAAATAIDAPNGEKQRR